MPAYTTLIDCPSLAQQLAQPDWLIVDVRHTLSDPHAGRTAYAEGHIPGAVFMHMDEDLAAPKTGHNGRHPLPDRAEFAARMAALGLERSTQIVVYDADGGMMAARLWWMMRWLGHSAVAVLDGGWPAWLAEHGAVTTALPGPRRAAPVTLAPPLTAQTDAAAIIANFPSGARLVLDARGPDRFRGENETLDPRAGHIPGARNYCFRENLDSNGRFKDAATLRAQLSAAIAPYPADKVIAQCGSGVSACHNLLALEIAGLPGAALYPGSWSEWCSDPNRPVAV